MLLRLVSSTKIFLLTFFPLGKDLTLASLSMFLKLLNDSLITKLFCVRLFGADCSGLPYVMEHSQIVLLEHKFTDCYLQVKWFKAMTFWMVWYTRLKRVVN